jgi:hypothetical protein
MANLGRDPARSFRREAWRLGLLFGAFSFLQGFGEPTEGLLAQPVRSLLVSWGRSAEQVAAFSAILATPWFFKPLFGLLTDFVPLGGTRRKGYLIASSGAAGGALLALWAFPVPAGSGAWLLRWLLVATAAVAFSDVAADALMVERGQALGLTGGLQAVQWACNYGSGLLAGTLGGALSEWGRQDLGFLLCGAGAVVAMVLAVVCVREPIPVASPTAAREVALALRRAARTPAVLGIGAFLFLWNFNPFSTAVLHYHMTRALGFREGFYGNTLSLLSLSSIAACATYGLYSRRVPRQVLAHTSVALGVVSTLAYLAMSDERSAVLVTLAIGFTYMTATLIQFDLAAQVCPPEAAGTVFATLMAVSNLSAGLSTWLGGIWYERWAALCGSAGAFRALVLVGSAFTAGCWLLVPLLPRGLFHAPAVDSPTPLD